MLTSTEIAYMMSFRLYEMPKKGQSTEKEGEELLRDGKRGGGGMGSQRGRGFFLRWWKCSKTDGGDDCPYLWIHVNTTELYTLNRQIVWYMNYISVKVLVTQSCLTVYNPMDCSPPGSSVHGIFQARILEWIAISYSRGSPQLKDRTQLSCIAGRFFTI